MRAIIADLLHKALCMLGERKAAWQKVITSNHLFFWLRTY